MDVKLKEVLSHIENKKIYRLCKDIIARYSDEFFTEPAACGNHHAYPGGLYVHSTDTALLTATLCDIYSKGQTIDKSVAVAGALLHDIGKVKCYRSKTKEDENNKKVSYSSTRKSLWHHHIPIGFHIVASEIEKIKGFDEFLADHILHIIISHHGRIEYRSNRTPQTTEAFLVHQADSTDAYMAADSDSRRRFDK